MLLEVLATLQLEREKLATMYVLAFLSFYLEILTTHAIKTLPHSTVPWINHPNVMLIRRHYFIVSMLAEECMKVWTAQFH